MTSRPTSFAAGLALAAVGAFAALSDDHLPLNNSRCDHGHPVKRARNVTYGGLDPLPGYERDHIVPLCLGGLDVIGNMRYEPLEFARPDNTLEREACERYCSGEWTLDVARGYLAAHKHILGK